MLRIILKFSSNVINEFKIDQDEVIIGRDSDNDVQIDNVAVSREHAKIIRGPNSYLIEDLNSTNGTFVNGKKINFFLRSKIFKNNILQRYKHDDK